MEKRETKKVRVALLLFFLAGVQLFNLSVRVLKTQAEREREIKIHRNTNLVCSIDFSCINNLLHKYEAPFCYKGHKFFMMTEIYRFDCCCFGPYEEICSESL